MINDRKAYLKCGAVLQFDERNTFEWNRQNNTHNQARCYRANLFRKKNKKKEINNTYERSRFRDLLTQFLDGAKTTKTITDWPINYISQRVSLWVVRWCTKKKTKLTEKLSLICEILAAAKASAESAVVVCMPVCFTDKEKNNNLRTNDPREQIYFEQACTKCIVCELFRFAPRLLA